MTEFIITNETVSAIVFTTLDNFSLGSEDPPTDIFADTNGGFAVGDIIENSELQGLLDATDISIEDENSNAITNLFIINDLLATGNTKLDFISVTQTVDLDTVESDTITNNAKNTNATHTGEVIGSGALTADSTIISNKDAVTAASGMEILVNDSGTLKKADASDFLGGGNVYGTEYHYAESEGESDTTSGTYQLKTTLTTASLPSGNYEISWYSETRNSSTSGIVDVRVRYGTTEIGQTEIEHEDTSDWNPQGGFKSDISLSVGQTIELHYRRIDNGTATIRRSRLKIIKVS